MKVNSHSFLYWGTTLTHPTLMRFSSRGWGVLVKIRKVCTCRENATGFRSRVYVSDKEWSFAERYLTLMNVTAPQRKYDLREMFNALRRIARAGAP